MAHLPQGPAPVPGGRAPAAHLPPAPDHALSPVELVDWEEAQHDELLHEARGGHGARALPWQRHLVDCCPDSCCTTS